MAALTTVVVAAAATAVAGAVAGAGAATGSGVGAAQVPQQVNRDGPEASQPAGVGLTEGAVGAGGGTGSRPSPNRCPLQRGSAGGRRGARLPLLAAWPTPGVVLCWLVRLTASPEPPPCGFGIEERSGWKPGLCRFLAL